MKCERITLTHVRIPLVQPFKISSGEVREKDAILVTVAAGGLEGVGEASPMSGSFYSEETPESTWETLVDAILPRMLGQPLAGILEGMGRLTNGYALAGVETALQDLEAQRQGLPLYRMLGGSKKKIESGLAVGIAETIPELIETIEHYLADGYKRVKIKIQPGWDLEPLAEIRRVLGEIPLMVDANCAYRASDQDHLRRLDDYDLMMIEQPLPREDLAGHARLQELLHTPLCLDESASTPAQVREAIRLGSCKIVNIKIQRVGGLAGALEIHRICARAGIPVWGGTMPELGIGGGQTLHLCTLPNFLYPTDVEASRRWFIEDIIEPLIEVERGEIAIPPGAGTGYRLNREAVNRYRVREGVFRRE